MIQEKSIYAFLDEIKPLNILLIDDDLASQYIISKSLGNLGENLDLCSSPKEALDWITQKSYDLILVDLNLPLINGFEFSKALKSACQYRGCDPIIIGISGLNHPLLETLVDHSDIDDYIVRSIDYNDLKDKIVNHCYLHLN